MDEVSRALPPYTWLTSMAQTSAVPAPPGSEPPAPANGAAPRPPGAQPGVSPQADTVPQRLDVPVDRADRRHPGAHALHEAISRPRPSSKNVQLDQVGDDHAWRQREVTEFQLDAAWETPDPSVIRTVPVSLGGEVTMAWPMGPARTEPDRHRGVSPSWLARRVLVFLCTPKASELADTSRRAWSGSRRRTTRRRPRSRRAASGGDPRAARAVLAESRADAHSSCRPATRCRRCSSKSRRPRAASGWIWPRSRRSR